MADGKKCEVDCVSGIGSVRGYVDMDFDAAKVHLTAEGWVDVTVKDQNRPARFFRANMIAFVHIITAPIVKASAGLVGIDGRKLDS